MNGEYVQDLRHKLQRRMQQLNSAGIDTFHYRLQHFWKFLHLHPLLGGITDDLRRRHELIEPADNDTGDFSLWGNDEIEYAAIALEKLRHCVGQQNSGAEANEGLELCKSIEVQDALDAFRRTYLEPVYQYLDEQLDDQRALLSLLRRYKHRCEWFRRDVLLDLWQSDTAKGERALANDLYEYLYDQGLEFSIEPSSASGKPDLISAQVGNEKLIADAKVYKEGTSKSYLATGFHQIYQYTLDYSQPFGYLVIFKTCEDDLKFPMADQEQSIPFLVHNNKTVFFVVIDICRHEATASKRGALKTVEITEADLIQKTDEIAGTTAGTG